MVGKICARVKGGSARNGVRYVLGYAFGNHEKDDMATVETKRDAFSELMSESLMRDDFGVGQTWKPGVGDGTRPAAIYADGVTSLATADQEMDALAALGRTNSVRESTLHLIYSFSEAESAKLTDEQIVAGALTAMRDMGLGDDYAKVLSVHRDTDNAHVHALVSAVNSRTGLAWERNRDQFRMARGCRVAEKEHGFEAERGLYMTRDNGVIELASKPERRAWATADREARLDRLASKYLRDHEGFEDAKSWGEAFVADFNETTEAHEAAGMRMSAATAHRVAAKWGGRIERDDAGDLRFSIRERVERTDEGVGRARETTVLHDEERPAPDPLARDSGLSVTVARDRLRFDTDDLVSIEKSEADFIDEVRANPSLVSKAIVELEGEGVISREHVDAYLYARITDVTEAVELSDYVLANDDEVRMVAADTTTPVYVRRDFEALQRDTERNMRALSKADERFDASALERAMVAFEKESGYSLSIEQKTLVEKSAKYGFSWANGEAGAGKTTSMKVLKIYAKETNREVVGLATSQAAARKLGADAGISTFNLAKLLVGERNGKKSIPDGAFIICDESSLSSYRAINEVTRICMERGANFSAIGDSAQIQNIEAGSPHEIGKRVSQELDSYTELREVRRQASTKKGGRIEWMRALTARTGEAIRDGDKDGVRAFVRELDERGVVSWVDDVAEAKRFAAERYLAVGDPSKVILTTDDRLAAKQINSLIAQRLGLAGTGVPFEMRRGTREIAVGMRLQFQENNSRIGVDNNDLGTVLAVERNEDRWKVVVAVDSLEKNGAPRVVSFDPRTYKRVELGYAVTTTKAQGQDRYKEIALATKITNANSMHVAATRGTHELEVVVARDQFADADELGDHLAERIRRKDDALLLERVIEKTGGKETPWAKNVLAALGRENHPLRKQYADERRKDMERVGGERVALGERIRTRLRAAKTLAERAFIERDHRRESAAIAKREELVETRSFEKWSVEKKNDIEARLAVSNERLRLERGHGRPRYERDVERARNVTRARIERELTIGQEHERGLDR